MNETPEDRRNMEACGGAKQNRTEQSDIIGQLCGEASDNFGYSSETLGTSMECWEKN